MQYKPLPGTVHHMAGFIDHFASECGKGFRVVLTVNRIAMNESDKEYYRSSLTHLRNNAIEFNSIPSIEELYRLAIQILDNIDCEEDSGGSDGYDYDYNWSTGDF